MLKYAHLALIMVAAYFPDMAWAMPTLATIQVFFAVMFYWLCFGLLSGLKTSGINPEMDTPGAWTNRIVQTGATAVLFLSWDPVYQAIAIFTLPWIIINIFTDILATLVKWEIVDITDKEEEDH
jgi:hypothetical protein